jgi:hypothetical protein
MLSPETLGMVISADLLPLTVTFKTALSSTENCAGFSEAETDVAALPGTVLKKRGAARTMRTSRNLQIGLLEYFWK